MRFWDSSAVVPLLVAEPASLTVLSEFDRDPDLVVWWATDVECVSALARLEREANLAAAGLAIALRRLDALRTGWQLVQPVERIRTTAIRLLRVHPLRAGDALQLAAAIVAAEEHPATLPFVTLDQRLRDAAEREGFPAVQPGP